METALFREGGGGLGKGRFSRKMIFRKPPTKSRKRSWMPSLRFIGKWGLAYRKAFMSPALSRTPKEEGRGLKGKKACRFIILGNCWKRNFAWT
jgi:hypothetical protein